MAFCALILSHTPLQKPFGVHANGGEAGAHWFSMAFIQTEHCYVFMYVTNADDPFSLYCHSFIGHTVIVGLGLGNADLPPFYMVGVSNPILDFQS